MIRHDRSFPETVADRVVEIQDCALANYEGGWEYYERKMREAGAPLDDAKFKHITRARRWPGRLMRLSCF